jgi:hypothetical protein
LHALQKDTGVDDRTIALHFINLDDAMQRRSALGTDENRLFSTRLTYNTFLFLVSALDTFSSAPAF